MLLSALLMRYRLAKPDHTLAVTIANVRYFDFVWQLCLLVDRFAWNQACEWCFMKRKRKAKTTHAKNRPKNFLFSFFKLSMLFTLVILINKNSFPAFSSF